MEESMIEKVARAIFEECNRQSPVAGFGYADADGGKTVLDGAYDLTAVARAAVEAMREPTEEMEDAFFAPIHGTAAASYLGDEDWSACYRSSINAALKETNP